MYISLHGGLKAPPYGYTHILVKYIFAFVCDLGYNKDNRTQRHNMKTQTTIRVEETNYHKAKEILDQMGLSYSQAIGVFNSMVVMNKGLPFEVKIPTKRLQKSIDSLNDGNTVEYAGVEEMMKDLKA